MISRHPIREGESNLQEISTGSFRLTKAVGQSTLCSPCDTKRSVEVRSLALDCGALVSGQGLFSVCSSQVQGQKICPQPVLQMGFRFSIRFLTYQKDKLSTRDKCFCLKNRWFRPEVGVQDTFEDQERVVLFDSRSCFQGVHRNVHIAERVASHAPRKRHINPSLCVRTVVALFYVGGYPSERRCCVTSWHQVN